MHKICRINLGESDRIYEKLNELAEALRSRYKVKKIYLYGSFAGGIFTRAVILTLL